MAIDFTELYEDVSETMAKAQAGGVKPCVEIPCPPWSGSRESLFSLRPPFEALPDNVRANISLDVDMT